MAAARAAELFGCPAASEAAALAADAPPPSPPPPTTDPVEVRFLWLDLSIVTVSMRLNVPMGKAFDLVCARKGFTTTECAFFFGGSRVAHDDTLAKLGVTASVVGGSSYNHVVEVRPMPAAPSDVAARTHAAAMAAQEREHTEAAAVSAHAAAAAEQELARAEERERVRAHAAAVEQELSELLCSSASFLRSRWRFVWIAATLAITRGPDVVSVRWCVERVRTARRRERARAAASVAQMERALDAELLTVRDAAREKNKAERALDAAKAQALAVQQVPAHVAAAAAAVLDAERVATFPPLRSPQQERSLRRSARTANAAAGTGAARLSAERRYSEAVAALECAEARAAAADAALHAARSLHDATR